MPAVSFLALPTSDRRAIINAAGQQLGRSPQVIEKDIWVCWTLATLKEVPGVPPFAFKGGTSLSKVYDAIARFSEDVDVTLDRTVFAPTLDPFADISNTQRKKISLALDAWLDEFSITTIKPHFDQAMIDALGTEARVCLLGEQRPGQLYVPYASVIDRVGEYDEDQVFLELGAKNKIIPNKVHVINT